MPKRNTTEQSYNGFEQGPIRPPSEAGSLLIRVTRNCPWNHCTFCPVYKNSKFSLRPVEHVIKDIDIVHGYVDEIRKGGDIGHLRKMKQPGGTQALEAARHWNFNGMSSIFIQDANSLIIKPVDMVKILTHLRNRFPWVERITSYARSHTIARISDADLKAFCEAGLNRVHIGMESASDEVLKMVKKGSSKANHIKAGIKVKEVGMELSEYIMPGLGGQALSESHARESADALNQINPDFIRLRTLAIPNGLPLFDEWEASRFQKCTEMETTREIKLFLESLDGITSTIKSDHILNLFEEIQGKMPEDKQKMLNVLQTFLDMSPEDQCIYLVGRRLGLFARLSDVHDQGRRKQAEQVCKQYGITPDNVDQMINEMMKRFI